MDIDYSYAIWHGFLMRHSQEDMIVKAVLETLKANNG